MWTTPTPAGDTATTHRASRDLIYAALLRSMSPEHKFNSAAKLCGEVLAGVADGLLPLSECEEVLRDALCLMACKEIKVCGPGLFGSGGLPLGRGSSHSGDGTETVISHPGIESGVQDRVEGIIPCDDLVLRQPHTGCEMYASCGGGCCFL